MTAFEPMERDVLATRAEVRPEPAGTDPRTWPTEAWPEPQALPDGLPPVAPFDCDLLPDRLRPWVEDVAERMQCPPDFVAVPMVAAVGNLIGRRCAIRPQARSDWQEFPNLWGCIVGRPGMMKSPAMTAALAPVARLEARALEAWESAQAGWKADAEIAKARAEAIKADALKALKKNPSDSRKSCTRRTVDDYPIQVTTRILDSIGSRFPPLKPPASPLPAPSETSR